MNRRQFHQVLGGSTAFLAAATPHAAAAPGRSPGSPLWPGSTYRRLLVDTHIPDWDPQFLAKFDPLPYVDLIADSGFQSLMQYAQSAVGLCMYPTRVGRMHANLKGRDVFGEVIRHCHERGLHTVAYFCAIHDNWAFENHPDWRLIRADGDAPILKNRSGLVCPNTPYRHYILDCLREVAAYEVDGLFVDMTFWPQVCYCPYCVTRYRKEKGLEPPRRVDWDSRAWLDFQNVREAWMLEFTRDLTQAAQAVRPITVNHQCSSLLTTNWIAAQPFQVAEACDYVGGDFYGGPAAYSLACKAFYGLSRKQPFEFHTTRTRRPNDHVTTKSPDELQIEAHVATLHSGALCFIDGINPDGTLEPQVYRMLADLNRERAGFEPYLGGEMLADVAVYMDRASMYDPAQPAASPAEYSASSRSCPHVDGFTGAARVLQEEHIPFGVVTSATLDQLRHYRAVILSNVLEMTVDQAAVFRNFVAQGGLLYASGPTSLDRFSKPSPHFLLEDVLGVRYRGRLGTKATFLSPVDESLLHAVWPQRHVIFAGSIIDAEALPGARVLATATLPFVPPEAGSVIGDHFASIWSNPPAFVPGKSPACVVNSFKAGKAIWVGAPFEAGTEAVNHKLLTHLLRSELKPPYRFEADAHSSVEVTLFDQPSRSRLLVSLLSMQEQLPALPVDATVRVRKPETKTVRAVVRVPEGRPLPYTSRGPYIEFKTGSFKPFTMVYVDYA